MTFVGADPRDGDPARPLLLLLHGYGSHERDLPGLAAHLPGRFDWVSLRAPLPLPHGGFAWTPLPKRPGQLDPAVAAAAGAAILDWVDAHAGQRTVVPLGFSQGGLMVTELLRARPGRFPAGVVLSGFADPVGRPGDTALAADPVPVFFGWGTADAVIPEERFRAAARWLAGHSALRERVYPGLPHAVSGEELADLAEFLEEAVPAA